VLTYEDTTKRIYRKILENIESHPMEIDKNRCDNDKGLVKDDRA